MEKIMNSFEIALDALDKNSIDIEGEKAIKLCNAADDLLAALEKAVDNDSYDRQDWYEEARAAIAKALA